MSAPMSQSDAFSLDMLREPVYRANPYPLYARMREAAPVHYVPFGNGGTGTWLLTRYADVRMVLVDPRFSAQRFAPSLDWMPEELQATLGQALLAIGHQLLFIDPPEHTRLRGLVNHAFLPRVIEAMRPHIREIVDGLLDSVAAKGGMDVMADIAVPLPTTVICEMLGIPLADREQMARWTQDFGAILGGAQLTLETALAALQGIADMMSYLRGIYQNHQAHPRDDLMQAFITAEEHGQTLSEEEILANLVLLFAAGHGTTTHLIGNGLLALLRHPDQMERLRAEPALMPNAVNELLRFDGPVQFTDRRTREEMTIAGQAIPAGANVTVILGAANHDPAQFPHPDDLDLARPEANKLLSFGYGPHFCLGAPLARLEASIVFGALLERFSHLTLLSDDLSYDPSLVFRGLLALPVALA